MLFKRRLDTLSWNKYLWSQNKGIAHRCLSTNSIAYFYKKEIEINSSVFWNTGTKDYEHWY